MTEKLAALALLVADLYSQLDAERQRAEEAERLAEQYRARLTADAERDTPTT